MQTITDAAHPSRTGASPEALAALADRVEIVDALYRFAAGQDLRDRELFESAFAPEATFDFTGPAAGLGADVPVFTGRPQIVDTILAATSPLRTTHTVTNPRVAITGDRATLLALVEAQHVSRTDTRRHLLLKNVYRVQLRRDGAAWVMTHVAVETAWREGDTAVLFPSGPAAR